MKPSLNQESSVKSRAAKWAGRILIVCSLIVVAWVAATPSDSSEKSTTRQNAGNPVGWQTPAKAAYQQRLNHHPDRESGNLVGVRDGHVLVAEPKNGQQDRCSFRCIVVEKRPGGEINLLLDAGFRYDPKDTHQLINETDRFNAYPVTTMTYWDPSQHRVKTVRSENEEAVKLPDVLRARKVSDLRVGQTGYVSMFEIIERSQGRYGIFKWANLGYEAPKALYDGDDSPTVPVTRVSPEHFVLCLPPEGAAIYEERDVYDDKLFAASRSFGCNTQLLPLL